MINFLNNKVNMSSAIEDNKLIVNIEEHTIYFDNTHDFNKQFISHVKRGNGFKKNEIKEPSTTRALYNLSKNYLIGSVVDIGCQNFYTTLQLAKIFDCTPLGFDIDMSAIDAGMLSLDLNPDLHVEVIEEKMGSKDRGDNTLNELKAVDLILIDIEGYQYYVFKDGLDYIKDYRPIIVYETDNRNASLFVKPDKIILKPLEDLEYTFFHCDDHRKNKPFIEKKCDDIPVEDGMLILIPKEKL